MLETYTIPTPVLHPQIDSSCPSVHLWTFNRVRSAYSTILAESISYLHILSTDFTKCFACRLFKKFEILPNHFTSSRITLGSERLWISAHISGMGGPIDMEQKGYGLIRCPIHYMTPHPCPWALIFKFKIWNGCISGMGWSIAMERKGYESIGC